MAELAEEILGNTEFMTYIWWRYIDDLFFLWEYGEEKLKSFIDNINKMHPAIKLTAYWSKTSIDFLDVAVSIAEVIVETHLYVEPTNSRLYLLSSSCHHIYFKKGIPHSQALRLTRICSYMSFLIKTSLTSRNIYWKVATARKWYVRIYFKLEEFPEMHF